MTAIQHLPDNWVSTTLDVVAEWGSGGTPSRSHSEFFGGSVPWIKTGELGPRTISATEEHLTEDGLNASSAKLFPPGSVALAMYGATIGKASILGIEAATNQACAVGFPLCLSSQFLYYFLVSQAPALASAGQGGAQPNISQGVIRAWPIGLPPSREQERIVEALDESLSVTEVAVAELIAAKRKLTLYRQSLLKSAVEGALTVEWRKHNPPKETGAERLTHILRERKRRWEATQYERKSRAGRTPARNWEDGYPPPASPELAGLPKLPLGWVWSSLDAIADIQGGIQKQPSRAPVLNRYPFLRVANVSRGALRLDDVHEIELVGDELRRLRLEIDDLLIVEGNGSLSEIGRCARWDASIANTVHQNHLIRARPLKMAGAFVEAWINSPWGKDRLTALAATTSGLYTLSVGKLARVPVPIAPLQEQEAIIAILAEQVGALEHQAAAIDHALALAAAQRQNILRAAFSGQLVAQDPNDEPASVLLERIRTERLAAAPAAKRKPSRRAKAAA